MLMAKMTKKCSGDLFLSYFNINEIKMFVSIELIDDINKISTMRSLADIFEWWEIAFVIIRYYCLISNRY